jgi:hypothetical protein
MTPNRGCGEEIQRERDTTRRGGKRTSADRRKLTPTLTLSSRYAATTPELSMRPLNRHWCRK